MSECIDAEGAVILRIALSVLQIFKRMCTYVVLLCLEVYNFFKLAVNEYLFPENYPYLKLFVCYFA